jgi:protein required for attachment to host cells
MDPRTDSHTNEVRRFASEVGAAIQVANDEGKFDEVAVIAPPRFLGLLRKRLDGVKPRLRVSAPHDYTHVPVDQLAHGLKDLLPGWFKSRSATAVSAAR